MSFRRVDIDPGETACEIGGFLYSCDEAKDLGQDMLEVRLPNGIRINAGWYPEGDPEGRYQISVWGARELAQAEYLDVDEAAREIESLIAGFSNGSARLPERSNTMSETAAALLRQGLAEARAGTFSSDPPDLKADAALVGGLDD